MTTFLRFESEQQFNDLKEGATPSSSWDVIGKLPNGGTEMITVEQEQNIFQTDSETGEEVIIGTEIVEVDVEQPTYHSGWHVNLLGELPENMVGFVINPSTPSRMFG